MKRSFNILLIMCVVMGLFSCSSKTKSYTDMLKDEKKAIRKLFDENGFTEIKDFPSNGVFKANEFYKMDNDVYINIVDSGNGQRAEMYKTVVYSRFTATRFSLDSTQYTITFSNDGMHSNGTHPVEFQYGYYTARPAAGGTLYQSYLEALVSEGMQSGLQYVGDRGKVKLIVPFKVGASDDMSAGYPVFFESLDYKFEENL